MSNHMIEISGLSKQYGSQKVVNNLNLNIEKGEVFGLLGPNGAGKSTTIRMILGMTEPSSGTVKVNGYLSNKNPIKVKECVGYLPEDVGFYDKMTAFENLMYTAQLNRISKANAKKKVIQLLNLVGLYKERNKKAGTFSKGMKQRLGLADVLIKDPKVIILDEPTLGLDPKGMKEFLDLIKQLSEEKGVTVLFSSHHLHQVQHICSRVGLFVNGQLIASGDVNSLSTQLFGDQSAKVFAGVKYDNNNEVNNKKEALRKQLLSNPEISGVKFKEEELIVECKNNMSSYVAKSIVNQHLDLTYLHKKEYGLDEIYNKYFEGGDHHES